MMKSNGFKLTSNYKESTFDFDEIPNDSIIWNHWDRHKLIKEGRNPEYNEYQHLKKNLEENNLLGQVEKFYISPDISEFKYRPRYTYIKQDGVVIQYDHKQDTELPKNESEMIKMNGSQKFKIIGSFIKNKK